MEDWVDIASILQDRHGWDPAYWVSSSSKRSQIKQNFPNCAWQDKHSAARGVPAESYDGRVKHPLDQDLVFSHGEHYSIGLKMMDRLDPGRLFAHDQRHRHFSLLLGMWYNIIKELDINFVVFSQVPHVVSDYSIYAVCEELDIPTIMFKEVTPVNGFVYSQKDIHNPPPKIVECKQDKNINIDPPDILNDYTESLRAEEKEREEEEERNIPNNRHIELLYKGLRQPQKVPRFVMNKITPDILQKGSKRLAQKNTPLEDANYSRLWYIRQNIQAARHRKLLKKSYNEISVSPDLDDPYVYFPLHYQPELTSSPLGGIYAHQYLIVNLLSCVIPDNWTIYIKEHPVQFSQDRIGHQGRQPSHYKEINQYDNVSLLDIDSKQSHLLENAQLVATITGTAGWESVVKGTPSVVFGNAWYRCCDAVFYAQTKEDVESVINEIKSGYSTDKEQIDQFLSVLATVGFEGYLNPSRNKPHIDRQTNVNRIVNEIENELVS